MRQAYAVRTMFSRIFPWRWALAGLCLLRAGAQTNAPAAPDNQLPAALAPGHSAHGQAFNEGPRQPAYLMAGMPKIEFTVTTTNELAQKFFTQGVGQWHGFWFFEAERSFRQAAVHDPNCAMAYWGMAMANFPTTNRAPEFIAQAVKLKGQVSRREQLRIEALAEFFKDPKRDEKDRRRDYVRALENLVFEFPDDIEAKAFLAFHIWDNAYRGHPIPSAQAVESLLKEVFAAQPMHPAHHYRVHLWDGEPDPVAIRALPSAALCGRSGPGIAHLWHMPGHTFNKLKRYEDMAWQQEASVRVDNAQLMRDRVMPDQIHNYSHNSEWLVQTLNYVGRVRDALALARNMIEMPRHPKFNTLDLQTNGVPYEHSGGTAADGRQRLVETLLRYELWEEALQLAETPYLPPTDLGDEQARRARLLAVANFALGKVSEGRAQIAILEHAAKQLRVERAAKIDFAEAKAKEEKKGTDEAGKAMEEALRSFRDPLQRLDDFLGELKVLDEVAGGATTELTNRLESLKTVSKERLALLWLHAGDTNRAEKLAREAVEGGTNQVQLLANQTDILWRLGKTNEAKAAFAKLRERSAFLDLDLPVVQRLKPIVAELGLPADWRQKPEARADSGTRPELASLGPLLWQPTPAPDFSLPTADGKAVSLRDYRGKPVIVVFYLGHGCIHCLEQLAVFAPAAKDFQAAGITLLAVSADSQATLGKTVEKAKVNGGIPFPLVADGSRETFRAYRAYDGFEQVPLHGVFLVDGAGLVRWQDISHEPFTDVRFLLTEAKRQLLWQGQSVAGTPKASGTPGGQP